jgi:hypothetical protein
LLEAYMNSDKTQPSYFAISTTSTGRFFVDLSSPGRLRIRDDEGNSFEMDDAGMRFASPSCSVVLELSIPGLLSQLEQFGEIKARRPNETLLRKRFEEVTFPVALTLADICNQPLPGANPSLSVGSTPCSLLRSSPDGLDAIWTCQFPGENSGEMKCENSLNAWLDPLTGGFRGTVTNWPVAVAFAKRAILKWAAKETLAAAIIAIGITLNTALLPAEVTALLAVGAAVSLAIDLLALFQIGFNAYNALSAGGVVQDICMLFHEVEFPIPLELTAWDSVSILEKLDAAPAASSGIVQTVTRVRDCPSSTIIPSPGNSTSPSAPTASILAEKSGWKFTFGLSDEVSAWTADTSLFVPLVPGGQLSVNTRCIRVREVTWEGGAQTIPRGTPIVWETLLDPFPGMQADTCCLRLSGGTSCETGGSEAFLENCVGINSGSPLTVNSFQVYGCTGQYVPSAF